MTLRELAESSKASQDWFEFWQLLELVQALEPKRILEIGVHRGGCVETFTKSFPDAHVVGVDLDYSFLEFTNFYALAGDSHLPSMREAVKDAFKGEQVDFLYIDGDHNYEGVKKDFEMYGTMVRPGGLIAFHDVMRMPGQVPGVEVRQFFDEVKQRYASIEIWNGTAGPNGPGTGVLFV